MYTNIIISNLVLKFRQSSIKLLVNWFLIKIVYFNVGEINSTFVIKFLWNIYYNTKMKQENLLHHRKQGDTSISITDKSSLDQTTGKNKN